MKAKIYVVLKPGFLDAQGNTIKGALDSLGFRGVKDVRVGKYVEIELERAGTAAQRDVERMCQKLLANPVIETYRIEMSRQTAAGNQQSAVSNQRRATHRNKTGRRARATHTL